MFGQAIEQSISILLVLDVIRLMIKEFNSSAITAHQRESLTTLKEGGYVSQTMFRRAQHMCLKSFMLVQSVCVHNSTKSKAIFMSLEASRVSR